MSAASTRGRASGANTAPQHIPVPRTWHAQLAFLTEAPPFHKRRHWRRETAPPSARPIPRAHSQLSARRRTGGGVAPTRLRRPFNLRSRRAPDPSLAGSLTMLVNAHRRNCEPNLRPRLDKPPFGATRGWQQRPRPLLIMMVLACSGGGQCVSCQKGRSWGWGPGWSPTGVAEKQTNRTAMACQRT